MIVSLGVLADGWVADFPLAPAPATWTAESCAGPDAAQARGALIELPLGDPFRDVAAMYRGMSQAGRWSTATADIFPPHYAALRFGLDLRDDDVLTQLATHGVSEVVIDGDRRS